MQHVLKTRAGAQFMVNTVLEGLQRCCRKYSILPSKANGHDSYDTDEQALSGIVQSSKISFCSLIYV
jgi:hypothetical protein